MIKIIHGADFHLDSPFSGLSPQLSAQRRGEQRELLDRLARLAREERADLVLLFSDHIELVDYKTDRGKSAGELAAAYRAQLALYALAIEKRFAPRRVTYKGIYSLALGRLVDVE